MDKVARNFGRSDASSSTVSIRDRGAELARASGHRSAIRVTASTAPGSSGRCSAYRSAIAAITVWATSSADSDTPRPSLR